jgi:hypothetical protein
MPRKSVSIVLALLILTSISFAAPATRPAADFSGEWETSYGTMKLTQKGSTITGTYGDDDRYSINGTLEGCKLTFTYKDIAPGEGWFEIADDGQSFSGKWRPIGDGRWANWTGKRPADAIAADKADNFTGLWKTSYGRMRLQQNGNTVSGIYNFGGKSTISGTIDGRILKFKYEQPDGEKGEGTFTLAEDSQSFAGKWQAQVNNALGGEWTGSRIIPQRGKTWLVVLEANWEHDLTQEEYSYGVMLRTFFARVPKVNIRHRYFGSEADFRRWTAELPYIAEPIILYISSHGTREGIVCGKSTIDGKTISECLKGANLQLLHFGTCLIAGGDIPRQIHNNLRAAGDKAEFPISGFANSADWAGSAVIDFIYLDLIFSKNLSPSEAVKQTRSMMTFARDKTGAGDVISPADLVIVEPKPAVAAQANKN